MVGLLVSYAASCVVPALAFCALAWFWRAWTGAGTGTRPRRLQPDGHRAAAAAKPVGPPIERLLIDLHHLGCELDRTRSCTAPAKVHRMTATSLAYDDVLLTCCNELDIPTPTPARSPLATPERLQLEAALAQTGAQW